MLETLDLRDVVLVGFSMGTGEVGPLLATYGTRARREAGVPRPRWSRSCCSATTTPTGVPQEVFDGIAAARRRTATPGTRSSTRASTTWTRTSAPGSAEEVVTAQLERRRSRSAPVAAYAVVPCVARRLPRRRRGGPRRGQPALILHGTRRRHPAHRCHRPPLPPGAPRRRLRRDRGRSARAAVDPRRGGQQPR